MRKSRFLSEGPSMRFVSILSGFALAAVLATSANASIVTIGVQEADFSGGALTQVATGTNTAVVLNQSYGVFTINNISGSSDSTFLNSGNSLNTSVSGPGTLSVFITASGLTSPVGGLTFLSSFTEQVLTAGFTVQMLTFLDNANGIFTTTTPLSSQAFSSIGSTVQAADATSGPGLFSLTEEFIITATGTGGASSTIVITAVPETSTWAMMILGFIGVGFAAYRRKAATQFRFV